MTAHACQRCIMRDQPGKHPYAIEDSSHQLVISTSLNPSLEGLDDACSSPLGIVASPAVAVPLFATAASGVTASEVVEAPPELDIHSDE